MTSRIRSFVVPLLLVSLVALPASIGAFAGDDDLDAIVTRLGSANMRDRIMGLRDMMRLKVPPQKARPILEKMIQDPAAEVRAELVWTIYELLDGKGTDLLEKLYADPDHKVRDGALRAACRMWNVPEARDLCRAGMDDPDHRARIEVINTLKEFFPHDPEAAALFRRGLEDPSEMVRRSAVFGAQAARDPKAVPLLAKILRESSDLAAVPAADEALATIGTDEAVDVLVSVLPRPKGEPGKPARPTDAVRAAAARALARIRNPKALPALRKVLDDPSLIVRLGAMEAILQMKDHEAAPLVCKQLSDKEERVRRFALRVLHQLGDTTCIDRIRDMMFHDPLATIRATATVAYADLAGEKAIPDLLKLREDLDWSVRLEAAGSPAGLGKPAAKALAEFLQDTNADVRAMAITGLGQIGGADQVPALAKLIADKGKKNRQVRMAVAEALGSIGSRKGVPVLAELANDPDPAVRQRAAASLGRIGGAEARKALEILARDRVSSVRRAAKSALDSMK